MIVSRRSFLTQLGLGATAAFASRAFALAPDSAFSLVRSTPEAEGVMSTGILDFLKGMEETQHELHSFMMVRHGKVVAEAWWAPYAKPLKHTMYSMSKSFTSTAVGLAVAEGKLSVEDKVISYFPDDLPAPISDNLAALRVKHLLTMSVGNEKEPTGAVVKSENWVRTFLAQAITHEPGTVFMYNSAATYMCSAIVQKVTGKTVIDYLTPKLFEPLGITGMTWETCPLGINTGGWGLSIQTEGLAKFGQLYLRKGKWEGRQLIPEAWVVEATTFKIQQPTKPGSKRPKEEDDWQQGYAYQFWRCQHGNFRGDGAFGQFTIVLPEKDAVIVMTSETKDMQGSLDLVWKHLLPAMGDKVLPAAASIAPVLGSMKLAAPKGNAAVVSAISGKTFKLDENALGLTSLNFVLAGNEVLLTAKQGTASHVVGHAMEDWKPGVTEMPGTPPRLISGGSPKAQVKSKVAASATWKDEKTLVLTWRYVETPHHDTVTCVFGNDTVNVTFLNSLAEMSGKAKDDRPVLTGKVAG